MEPTREQRITLDELLNRVLDKGVLIIADIVVSVAGIPLIGVNLKAALASIETMLEYGMMKDIDQACRNRAGQPTALHGIPLAAGETLAFETPGSLYFAEGIYGAWRYGILYVTNQRLLLFHRVFGKVLFSAPLANLRGIAIREGENKELLLSLEARRVVRIRAQEVRALAETLEAKVRRMGSALKMRMEIPIPDELPDGITEKGEKDNPSQSDVDAGGGKWSLASGASLPDHAKALLVE